MIGPACTALLKLMPIWARHAKDFVVISRKIQDMLRVTTVMYVEWLGDDEIECAIY